MADPWWEARRARYNVGLVLAGFAAFGIYAAVGQVRCLQDPDFEITLFTIGFQGVGYLGAMWLANRCYRLGAYVERWVRPEHLTEYRVRAYWAGFLFSVALPFLVPLGLWFTCQSGRAS